MASRRQSSPDGLDSALTGKPADGVGARSFSGPTIALSELAQEMVKRKEELTRSTEAFEGPAT